MIMEDSSYHCIHLAYVSGKVKSGIAAFLNVVVGKEIIQSEMTRVVRHVVHTGMGEMGQNIGLIQSRHSDLRDDHFHEC